MFPEGQSRTGGTKILFVIFSIQRQTDFLTLMQKTMHLTVAICDLQLITTTSLRTNLSEVVRGNLCGNLPPQRIISFHC